MFNNLTIKTRLTMVITILSVLLIVIGVIGMLGMSKANEGLQTVYADRTVPLMDLGLVIDMANRIRTNAVVAANAPNKGVAENANQNTLSLDAEIDTLWQKYMGTTLTT